VIFVDTNVWVYAVGRAHPLREPARDLIRRWVDARTPVSTSAEVLQELLHAYLPVQRLGTLAAAVRLATDVADVWPLEAEDVRLATRLAHDHTGVSARDLTHLATCLRRDVSELATFDQGLAAAFRTVT